MIGRWYLSASETPVYLCLVILDSGWDRVHPGLRNYTLSRAQVESNEVLFTCIYKEN